MSNYLMAKYTSMPFVAIPVFLHRRFRHGFVFLNASKGITKPSDLIGRKVGLRNFQATANLWIRGILQHEYGVMDRASAVCGIVQYPPRRGNGGRPV